MSRKRKTPDEPSIPIRLLNEAFSDGHIVGLTKPLADQQSSWNPHWVIRLGQSDPSPTLHKMWAYGFDKGRAQRIADLKIACGELDDCGPCGDPA